MGRVQALCSLLQSLLIGPQTNLDITMPTDKLHPLICTCFLFCYVWCLGGNLVEKSMDAFDTFCRDLFSETQDVKVHIHVCTVKTTHMYICMYFNEVAVMYVYICIYSACQSYSHADPWSS